MNEKELRWRIDEAYKDFGEIICESCDEAIDLSTADDVSGAVDIWNEHVRNAHRFNVRLTSADDDEDGRDAVKMVRLTPTVHERVKRHGREGETLSGTIGRAFDALEREGNLPDAVSDAMREGSEV